MQKTKLASARKSKNFSQEYMANALCIDVSNYSRREKGQIKIAPAEWEKISTVLEVPLESIYETDENMMFVYNDQSSGNSGNHFYSVPQYLLDTQKKYLEQLEAENQALKDKIKLLAGV